MFPGQVTAECSGSTWHRWGRLDEDDFARETLRRDGESCRRHVTQRNVGENVRVCCLMKCGGRRAIHNLRFSGIISNNAERGKSWLHTGHTPTDRWLVLVAANHFIQQTATVGRNRKRLHSTQLEWRVQRNSFPFFLITRFLLLPTYTDQRPIKTANDWKKHAPVWRHLKKQGNEEILMNVVAGMWSNWRSQNRNQREW